MKKQSLSDLVMVVVNIVQASIERVFLLTQLATLEAKLAVRTFVVIIFLSFILLLLTFATWLSLLFLIYTYLITLHFTPSMSALIIVGINFILILFISLIILNIKKNLWFPATRHHLHQLSMQREGLMDESIDTKD